MPWFEVDFFLTIYRVDYIIFPLIFSQFFSRHTFKIPFQGRAV